METAIAAAVRDELRSGRSTVALALLRVAQSMQGPDTSPLLAIDTLLQKAMLESATGNADEGAQRRGKPMRSQSKFPIRSSRTRTGSH